MKTQTFAIVVVFLAAFCLSCSGPDQFVGQLAEAEAGWKPVYANHVESVACWGQPVEGVAAYTPIEVSSPSLVELYLGARFQSPCDLMLWVRIHPWEETPTNPDQYAMPYLGEVCQ